MAKQATQVAIAPSLPNPLQPETPAGHLPEGSNEVLSSQTPKHDEIAVLAYRFWLERGCPEGSPELDWYRAETELDIIGSS
jgi:hypothetical protein